MHIAPGATYVFDKGYATTTGGNASTRKARAGSLVGQRDAALKSSSERAVDARESESCATQCALRAKRPPRGRASKPYSGASCDASRWRAPTSGAARAGDQRSESAPPEEIAQLYKRRWRIELFFKWVKQHLSDRAASWAASANAVRIQLLTALIAYMLGDYGQPPMSQARSHMYSPSG